MRFRKLVVVALVLTVSWTSPIAVRAQGDRQAGRNNEIDAPEGTRRYGTINGGGIYRFSGVVKAIVIREVNGNTTVDMSKLEAGDVTIGLVDGASCVLLNAKQSVTFTSKIDGRSWIAVKCGGDVTIKDKFDGRSRGLIQAGGSLKIEKKVDGGPCTILVFSAKRDFEVGEKIDGKAVLEEKRITNVYDLKSYPFDFTCDIDAPDYPRPKIP